MNLIFPELLADKIKSLVLTLPREAQWTAFAVLLALYLYIVVKIFSRLWCWADYHLATTLRRLRLSPLSIQYPLGDIVERAPRWLARIGWLFILITTVWAIIAFGIKPPSDSPLFWFQNEWGKILRTLWP